MPLYRARSLHPGYLAGRVYSTVQGSLITGTAIAAIDIIYFYSFILNATITGAAAKAFVQTLGAGSSMKCGIYANSTASQRPLGAPLFADNTGVTTQASSTQVSPALGSVTCYEGVPYWFGGKFTGTLPVMWSTGNAEMQMPYLSGNASTAAAGVYGYADTYSNNMPTIAEGASFTNPFTVAPVLFLAT